MISEMRESRRGPPRSPRRRRLRMVKELIRIGVGHQMLYLIGGSDRTVKLQREDMQKLEMETGKHIEEMYEEELLREMELRDIQSIPLTDDEKQIATLASKYVLAGYFILSSKESI